MRRVRETIYKYRSWRVILKGRVTLLEEVPLKKEWWTLNRLLWTTGAAWLILGGLMYFISPNWDKRGNFGDMFGSVNALFAGLAFSGIIYTIAIQRKEFAIQTHAVKLQTTELELQRKSIQMQTEELARSADQLEYQRKIMSFQIVMSTVNNMLGTKNEEINNIYVSSAGGRAAFSHIAKNYGNKQRVEDHREDFEDYISIFFDILQFIRDSDLDDSQKKDLGSIVFVNTFSDEYDVICIYTANHQHRSALLESFEFKNKMKSRKQSIAGISDT